MIRDKIDNFHLEDIKNELHPSVFFKHENYDLFILRMPMIDQDGQIFFKSKAFVITDQTYYHYDTVSQKFIDLIDINGFYKTLDSYTDNTLKLIYNYFSQLESIEDQLYENGFIKEFNKQWFKYKNELVRAERLLNKEVETISTLIAAYRKEDDYLERNFEDIHEHIQRAHRNAGLLLEKLDSLYNFNQTQTNEQMNRIVYILTLLSGIFLPLNLIVGFFGMNTTSLPFTQTQGGTFNVILLLMLSAGAAVLLTFLMKKR